jgi:hypothetical protein
VLRALLLTTLLLGGCGGTDRAEPSATTADRAPALLRALAANGEIVVHAESSPATFGPYELDGRYLARFEQYAPEDPNLDFAAQTSFVAALDPRPEQSSALSVTLFSTASRRATRRLALHGRYWLDVSFGDFPFVVRLTPLR